MNAVFAWFRIDLRNRWKSILVLALLIAFASGTILTAVAGARRGSSAVDRLMAATLPATVVALPNQPDFDWEAVSSLPEVEAVGMFAVSSFTVDNITDFSSFPVVGTDWYSTIERPTILAGRMLDPSRVDEVVVSPLFLEYNNLSVGDSITMRLFTPDQADGQFDESEMAPAAGPSIDATIVGSIRSMWFSDTESDVGGVTPSPALFDQYSANFLGAQHTGYVNALIRLTGGAESIPTFKADLERVSGRSDIDVWDLAAAAEDLKRVTTFEAQSLLVFSAAAFIAAIVLVGQAVARHVASTLGDLGPLTAVGMTPRESKAGSVIGPAISAVIGVAVGIPIAYMASRWFPAGTASWMEPSPGREADWTAFGPALVLVPILVVVGSFAAASITLSSSRRRTTTRTSAIAAYLARAGTPVPVVVGSRFALEPGQGSSSVPVRPALFGAIFGVLGIIAVFTFSSGIDATINDPQRFGQTWDLAAFIGLNGQDFVSADDLISTLADDPDIEAVNDTRLDIAQVDGEGVSVLTLDADDRPLDVVLTKGAVAQNSGEITIGPRTAHATGLDVGDVAIVTGNRGAAELKVTGIGFIYPGPHNDYASGAWVTSETYDSLFDGFKFHFGVLDLASDADPTAVAERMGAVGIGLEQNAPPPEQRQLLQVQAIPWFLAGFLALLGMSAVGHALATAARKRRHDLAVLRAVGMTKPQSRVVVVSQATILALVGLAIGIPLGVALGRTVWRYVADITPVVYVPPVSIIALVLVIPLSLLAANLMAVRPSRRAANMKLGEELRTE